MGNRNPVGPDYAATFPAEFRALSHNNLVFLRTDFENVERGWIGDSKTASLSDCVMMDTLMSAQNLSLGIHNKTRGEWMGGYRFFYNPFKKAFNKCSIITIRDKADFLAFRFIGNYKPMAASCLANLLLCQVS